MRDLKPPASANGPLHSVCTFPQSLAQPGLRMHATARQTLSLLRTKPRTPVAHRSILHPHFTRKSTAHRHPSARSTIPSATPSSR
jgi:hypothetical protein